MPRHKYQILTEKILLDEEDRHFLDEYSVWIERQGYASCDKRINGVRKRFKLHKLIMNYHDTDKDVDHINGNRLDNRKCNLQLVSRSYNVSNSSKRIDSKNKYKCITTLPSGNFSVKVNNGKRLGTFKDIELAKKCYLEYIYNKFGEIPYRISEEYAIN